MNWSALFFGAFLILECKSQVAELINQGSEESGVALYQLLQPSQKSFVFSAFSATTMCSLLANGAKGQTKSELLSTCNLPTDQPTRDQAIKQFIDEFTVNTPTLKLYQIHRIYPASNFVISQTFINNARDVYKTKIQGLTYQNVSAAAAKINNWVERRSNDLIKNAVNPTKLKPNTELVVVNILYLSGQWAIPFPKANTKKASFHIEGVGTKIVDTMSTTANVKYVENIALKAKFLQLDLKNSDFSLVIILSNAGEGLKLIQDNIEAYLAVNNFASAAVKISLPKFNVSTLLDDQSTLQNFGILKFYTDQADLTGIASVGKLHGNLIIQKAVIDASENGINVLSQTGVVSESPVPQAKFVFNACHPFVFYIKDKSTGVKLFLGRYIG